MLVEPYVKSIDVFRCPSDKEMWQVDWTEGWGGVPISYACNGAHTGPDTRPDRTPEDEAADFLGVMGMAQEWHMDVITKSTADVARPSETILVTEKHSGDIKESGGWGQLSSFAPGCIIMGRDDLDTMAANQLPNGTRAASLPYPNGPNGSVSVHPNAMANFVFCDGHVKAMKPAATNPDPANKPEQCLWDATRL